MNAVFKKLNYKDQKELHILGAPESFFKNMEEIKSFATVTTSLGKQPITFLLAFVTQQKQVNDLTEKIVKRLQGDAILWFAYPKGSSKKYTCEFNRDTGWAILGQYGFEGVRQVALDDDWSALRFRHADFIKTMTRSFAMSEAGKKKVAKKSTKK